MSEENYYCYTDTKMDNATYHAEGSLSRSWAARCRGKTGGRAQRAMERGERLFAGNKGTELGTHFDTVFGGLVEKRSLSSAFVVIPAEVLAADGSKRGLKYTSWRAESAERGETPVSQQTYDQFRAMSDALMEHRRARELVEATISTQSSVFWRDANGHARKARPDGVTRDLWYDVKTTASEWGKLRHSFREYSYDWQAAWYTDAAVQSGYSEFSLPFICVQTSAPYDVEVFTLHRSVVDRARREIDETLAAIWRRRKTGDYLDPTYGAEVEMDWKVEGYA